jgi:hypothetical protein
VLAGEVAPGTRILLDVEDGKLVLHTATAEIEEEEEDSSS